MASQRFLIAPFTSGLETEVRPWLLPEDAFEELNNMYVFRGRVRKRFGSQLMSDDGAAVDPTIAQLNSRLRIDVGTTDGNGDLAGTVPGAVFKVGQMFSIGTEIFTVNVTGTPAVMLTTGAATTHTYNTTTGAFVFAGAAATTIVFFYPAESVMGITEFETNIINDEPTFAFDTQFAYEFTGGGWDRLGAAPGLWTGDNSDFFWATTYQGATADLTLLFVSNFQFGATLTGSDPVKFWNNAVWTDFQPQFTATVTDTILTARVLIGFKDRLLYLNVVENTGVAPGINTQFGNRLRFSQNGSPVDVLAFRQDIPGRGGFLDAPTQEQIITAEFLKDRLIVFFERSTWELVYTGNEILPFRWQQINTELGAESTFSIVPFDKVTLGVGNVGIHACNGANVERIDDKIPDTVFEIHNENEGVKRVHGIRDFFVEMVYWAIPSDDNNDTFPTKVLVYNYRTGSWAINDDSITAFGYFQNQNDRTWRASLETWQESDFTWSTGVLQSQFRQVVAGNQEGFMFLIDSTETRNSPALQITDIDIGTGAITIIEHNLHVNDFVAIENLQGTTIDQAPQFIFKVDTTTKTTITLVGATFTGVYTGGGTVARVSNPEILSKQYNFFIKEGRNVSVNAIDFYVDKTTNGEISVDYFASSSNAVLETQILETRPYPIEFDPLEQTQARIWHRLYPDLEGDNIQIRTFLSDTQIVDENIAWSDLEIHALMFHASPTRSRFE